MRFILNIDKEKSKAKALRLLDRGKGKINDGETLKALLSLVRERSLEGVVFSRTNGDGIPNHIPASLMSYLED